MDHRACAPRAHRSLHAPKCPPREHQRPNMPLSPAHTLGLLLYTHHDTLCILGGFHDEAPRRTNCGRYEEAFVPESCRQNPRRPTVAVPSLMQQTMASDFQLLLPRRGPCNANFATDRRRSNAASYGMQRAAGTHCSTQRVNLQAVGTRRSATRRAGANALAVLQVNDYPMPMTPTAATATAMLPMPAVEQTGEVASTEASPAELSSRRTLRQ